MSNFGLSGFNNNFNNEKSLADLLKPYLIPQQSENTPTMPEQQRTIGNGSLYEINCQADIDYIEMDKTGRMQIFICSNEKRIYTRRWNHSKQKSDYKEYIEEEETKLTQNDTSAGMSQIAEALVVVANKLETMHNEIQGLKNKEPVKELTKEDTRRRSNGQFKKKGEA